MRDKALLQEKLTNDLELAQVKLAELKAKTKSTAIGVQAANDVRIEVLEQRIEEAKQRLLELNRITGSVPEQIAEGVEGAWSALQDSLQDVVSTFDGEHKSA